MFRMPAFAFAVFLFSVAGSSPVFAQTDQDVVIVCPEHLVVGEAQIIFTLNLKAGTVAEESLGPNQGGEPYHSVGKITAISDQELDWIMDDPSGIAGFIQKNELNRFTLDLDFVANSTGEKIRLSCHKQEKQL